MSSASQWKRCFTNPDSWTKWNIFSALFLGLELSIPTPRDTPHHICLSHTGRTRKTRIFLQKCCGFLGVPRPAESESDSCASIYLTEPGASPRTHPRGFYPAAPYPMGILLVFGSSEGKATNPSSKPRLEVWDSRRGTTEKAKWFPEHPLSSGTAGLGSSPLWQRNSTPTSFPMQKIIWEQPDNSKWKQKQLLINQGPGATRKRCSVLLLKKNKNPSAAAQPPKLLYKLILALPKFPCCVSFSPSFFAPSEGSVKEILRKF